MPMPTSHPPPTYYDILSLSQSAISSADDPTATALIKRAYRRALLSHHPDKQSTNQQRREQEQNKQQQFTIDQISTAYATLSRPSQRAAYNRSLLLLASPHHRQHHHPSQINNGNSRNSDSTIQSDFQTGIETVDLDDLPCQEDEGRGTVWWYRPCRCGNPRGYLFSEDDLEEASDLGELMVGCADCSLWLRVHFAVVDDEKDDDGQPDGDEGIKEEGRTEKQR
ncbi:Diphthamide biosynthesis protein 4 [Madurella fahalii]|uniref:Diphthamide biosynthesis protein 4 n=1 Tax=Madurella fahalii TaxID=1157608 RepID=A0ABQ0FYC4_9PEZI